MYALKRNSDGRYVARSGSVYSYTKKLEDAATFPTREAAEQNRCIESEHIVDVRAILERR